MEASNDPKTEGLSVMAGGASAPDYAESVTTRNAAHAGMPCPHSA